MKPTGFKVGFTGLWIACHKPASCKREQGFEYLNMPIGGLLISESVPSPGLRMGVFIDADEKFSAIRVSECGNGCK
jgi:hypothetical protein